MPENWADSLSEDWISQPRSSSPPVVTGTIDSLLQGSRPARALNERKATNMPNDHSTQSINTNTDSECGTVAVYKGAGDNEEWKRQVLGDTTTNDLFAKMPLENLFNPPIIRQSSAPAIQPQPVSTTPRTHKSYLPVPSSPVRSSPVRSSPVRSSPVPSQKLETFAEESGRGSSSVVTSGVRGLIRSDSEPTVPKPRFQTLLQRVNRRRAQSAMSDLGSDKNGKRKAERYADIDHDTRSRIILPGTEKIVPRPKPRILRPSGRWAKGHTRSSSDDLRRNELISPVSAGTLGAIGDATRFALTEPLTFDETLEEGEDQEQDDTIGELRDCEDVRDGRNFPQELESSVYPSSPPIMGHYRSRSEDTGYGNLYLEDSKDALGSLFSSPNKAEAKTPGLPSMLLASESDSLIRKIRQHIDAPKSPTKQLGTQETQIQPFSDSEDDPFYSSHPFRQQRSEVSSTPAPDQRHSSNDSSKSPMKLFHSAYDTYTAGKLDRRLDEMEKSNVRNTSTPPGDENPSRETSESERSYSGGSIIVNRLEAMARKSEKANSPSKVKVRYQKFNERTMAEEITTTVSYTHHRFSSAPSTSPNRITTRKHRRWNSDDSFTAINDGILAPRSPLRDPTPKRLRRSVSGAHDTSPESRLGFTPQKSPRKREHIRAVPEQGSILANTSRRSKADTMDSVKSAGNAMGRKGSPTPTHRIKKLPVIKGEDGIPPLLAIGLLKKSERERRVSGNRQIIFSGSQGDGMEGQGFEMPTPKGKDDSRDEDFRKSSFTTDCFLQEAENVMRNLRLLEYDYDDDDDESEEGETVISNDVSLPVVKDSGKGEPRNDNGNSPENQTEDEIALMLQNCDIAGEPSRDDSGNYSQGTRPRMSSINSQSSKNSRSSSRRTINNEPEILEHHLAKKGTNNMVFDPEKHRWVPKVPGNGEDDPFLGVSDISIDSREDEKALRAGRTQWESSPIVDKPIPDSGGLWPSSREINTSEINRSSSVGSHSERTEDSAFDPIVRTETRITSYGTDANDGNCYKETHTATEETVKEEEQEESPQNVVDPEGGQAGGDGDSEQGEVSNSEEQDKEQNKDKEDEKPHGVFDMPRLPARFADDFSSSPVKDDDKSNVDGFLEHGSLRLRGATTNTNVLPDLYSSGRRHSGRFFGRPFARISEGGMTPEGKSLHSDILNELKRLSLNTSGVFNSSSLTPLPTPFKTQMTVGPPSTLRKAEVSFHLTPLRDLSSHIDLTESLAKLDRKYISKRRGPKVTEKSIDASFTIAQTNLIKHLTDVEPYNPFWEHIKSLNLSDRKLETLFTLQEWLPRLTELDVSNNQLGQLSDVPATLFSLKVPRNNLSDDTFFGHLLHLHYVDISNNQLESLEPLSQCVHLREIRSDDNKLTGINGVFSIEGLCVLRCRRNKVTKIDFSQAQLSHLVEIDLRGNELTEVTGLEKLPSLVHVNFDQNQLSELSVPPNTKLTSIRSIKLTQNKFAHFDVVPFPSLRVLYMDNNMLSSVSGMTRAKNLDAVSFRDQQTENGDFTLDINRLFEVRKLYLSSNAIVSLDVNVPFFNLQYLEIASCQLRSLPDDFSALFPNLRVLNINYNRISDLRPITGCKRLEKLTAVRNSIDRMKVFSRVVQKLQVLRILDLRSNPFTLEFYPTPVTTNDKSTGPDEYSSDSHAVEPADELKDRQYQGRMDLESRLNRRHYEIIAACSARRLKELDGLKFSHEAANKEDEVSRELVNMGLVEEPYESSQSDDDAEGDEVADGGDERESYEEDNEEEESFIPDA